MVENPREAPGADTIRPLNLPTPIVVEMQGRRPVAITLRRRRYEIAAIDDTWEVADEWWRQHPISRAPSGGVMKSPLSSGGRGIG